MVDRSCNAIDQQLSEWFFSAMMGIRMEARPLGWARWPRRSRDSDGERGAGVDLAVRARRCAFRLFFILVIALVGGWVVPCRLSRCRLP